MLLRFRSQTNIRIWFEFSIFDFLDLSRTLKRFLSSLMILESESIDLMFQASIERMCASGGWKSSSSFGPAAQNKKSGGISGILSCNRTHTGPNKSEKFVAWEAENWIDGIALFKWIIEDKSDRQKLITYDLYLVRNDWWWFWPYHHWVALENWVHWRLPDLFLHEDGAAVVGPQREARILELLWAFSLEKSQETRPKEFQKQSEGSIRRRLASEPKRFLCCDWV